MTFFVFWYKWVETIYSPSNKSLMRNLGFIKENGLWYVDLPEFLERGLGTRNNLLMVDGSDTFLDLLSNQGNRVTLTISEQDFEGCQGKLDKIDWGKNQSLLDSIGHAPVDYGAYYMVNELKGKPIQHRLWLCPVTEFVFGGYPNQIFISIINN